VVFGQGALSFGVFLQAHEQREKLLFYGMDNGHTALLQGYAEYGMTKRLIIHTQLAVKVSVDM